MNAFEQGLAVYNASKAHPAPDSKPPEFEVRVEDRTLHRSDNWSTAQKMYSRAREKYRTRTVTLLSGGVISKSSMPRKTARSVKEKSNG